MVEKSLNRYERGQSHGSQCEVCATGLLSHITENTHLLRKGKYHCTADFLFDWFGFSCFVELKL